jgi:glycosyltransferase involved in cell wall biosynthesis
MTAARRTSILYVHHRPELGGAPSSLAQLIGGLDRARWEPHVFCPPGPAAGLFRDAGAVVHTGAVSGFTHIWASTYHGLRWLLLARELARLPAHVVALRRLFDAHRFALVHLNDSPLVAAAVVARRRHVPVVWHLRSALPGSESLRSRLLRRAVRRLAAISIAINEDVAASFRAGSEVIPNSVDLDRFTPGEPETPPTVAYVGFLYPWKGSAEYLRAAALVRARGVPARFLVVGGGVRDAAFFRTPRGRLLARFGLARDHEAFARSLVEELGIEGAVGFVPYTPDLVPIYRGSSVVVSPSQGPELPRPVVEAAACGVPVVSSGSRTGGGIVVPGETGVLVEPGSPEAIAGAVSELLGDAERRARMGRAARAHAQEAFDRTRNLGRVVEIYDRLIDT